MYIYTHLYLTFFLLFNLPLEELPKLMVPTASHWIRKPWAPSPLGSPSPQPPHSLHVRSQGLRGAAGIRPRARGTRTHAQVLLIYKEKDKKIFKMINQTEREIDAKMEEARVRCEDCDDNICYDDGSGVTIFMTITIIMIVLMILMER